ncbi:MULTISPECIES: prevent-host-death protein [Alteromonadaceae]|jgi:PHD/YefM family antitoxin component YafN of YafNO toxin-antitoxin module|uniref:Prevent-host-death protein n=1 Tax=Brumicola blandensis TaxID=3075611 RepID=A0AAW8R213_9ALTE|nr:MULTISPECIES: prevent-host-death protein [unclassified Alteromonas]MDT0582173.1 prevent-host-death protein [Alteromonas sp. W409]MDT0627871.1 prevent-host-death protein [Alteromonas sp. W364]
MSSDTFTSRQFNQDPSSVKRAAKNGPVKITERGVVAFMMMNIDDYLEITGKTSTILDLVSAPNTQDIQLDVPKFKTSN